MARLSNANAVEAIKAREVFSNNSDTMIGRKRFAGWGDLPADYQMPATLAAEQIIYWVYSYGTPIAWVFREGDALMPPVRYTTTTDKQQRIVAEALGLTFCPVITVTPAEEL